METFVFREELEETRLQRHLQKLMETHLLANIEKLSSESGLSKNVVRALVEALIVKGKIERLRPLNYDKDDMDFYLLCHLPRQAPGMKEHRGRLHRWDRWLGSAKRAIQMPIFGQRQHAFS
jgi:hypothetical protein